MRKGYAVVLLDVADAGLYREYARRATEIEQRHGAVPLIASAADEVVDGSWPAERVVVLEFPSFDDARAWYIDPDYQDLIPMRHRATTSTVLLVEGLESAT
jgi:uncharacterized protein (DUF1330 family)